MDAPQSAVTRLAAGPPGTLIAGFADGSLGLWSDRNGVELARWQLHGPVRDVALGGRTLTATSELGDTLTEDLGLYTLEYCELMRQVWTMAPIALLDGVVVVRPPPSSHRCAPSPTRTRELPPR